MFSGSGFTPNVFYCMIKAESGSRRSSILGWGLPNINLLIFGNLLIEC